MQPLQLENKDSHVLEYNMNEMKTDIQVLEYNLYDWRKDNKVLEYSLYDWKTKVAKSWSTTCTIGKRKIVKSSNTVWATGNRR